MTPLESEARDAQTVLHAERYGDELARPLPVPLLVALAGLLVAVVVVGAGLAAQWASTPADPAPVTFTPAPPVQVTPLRIPQTLRLASHSARIEGPR